MIDSEHLHLFITEEIFVLSDELAAAAEAKPVPAPTEKEEAKAQVVAEPTTPLKSPAPSPPDVKPETETPKIHKKLTPASPTMHEVGIWTPTLSPEERSLLTAILGAVQKDLNKCLLMEGESAYQPHYQTLICFGYQSMLESKAEQEFPNYKLKKVGTRQFLTSASLDVLMNSREEKTKLWNALKGLFPTA